MPPRRQSIRHASQLFKLLACNGGVKGQGLLRSLGGAKGDILSRERISPFFRTPHGAGNPFTL